MISKKVWPIVNVSLVIIVGLLVLNLFEVKLPTLGKSTATLKEESVCVIKNWQNEFVDYNVEDCCLDLKRFTFGCQRDNLIVKGRDMAWVCLTKNKIEYWLNNPANEYCKKVLG